MSFARKLRRQNQAGGTRRTISAAGAWGQMFPRVPWPAGRDADWNAGIRLMQERLAKEPELRGLPAKVYAETERTMRRIFADVFEPREGDALRNVALYGTHVQKL